MFIFLCTGTDILEKSAVIDDSGRQKRRWTQEVWRREIASFVHKYTRSVRKRNGYHTAWSRCSRDLEKFCKQLLLLWRNYVGWYGGNESPIVIMLAQLHTPLVHQHKLYWTICTTADMQWHDLVTMSGVVKIT